MDRDKKLSQPLLEPERAWFLKNTEFARRVSAEDMAVFRRVCPDRRYPKGRPIFHLGDPALDLHIIAQGQVKLSVPTASGSERIVAICGAGDLIASARAS